MNKEELKNIENHRQDLIKENNTLTNLLEIERKQVGRLAEQLILSGVSQQRELLLAYEKSQYETTWWMSEGEITNRINDFLANNCG